MDSVNSGSLQTSSGGDEANSFFSNYTTLLLNPNIPWPEPTRPDPNPSILPTPTVEQNREARNPKKRSRASRRAPTTVLTTDTTNFRAMVQEFTGIPAQPFDNTSRSGMRYAALEAPPPPYVRRPFAQKVQSPPLLSSNLFTFQNPLISSLLQSNPRFICSNSASKPDNQSPFQIQLNDTQIGLPNLISPDQNASFDNAKDSNAECCWDDGGDNYEAQMKRLNGGYIF